MITSHHQLLIYYLKHHITPSQAAGLLHITLCVLINTLINMHKSNVSHTYIRYCSLEVHFLIHTFFLIEKPIKPTDVAVFVAASQQARIYTMS